MSSTVHKVLIHGSDIIDYFHLAIGYYSDEVQECNNKVFGKARLVNSKMIDRQSINLDIMHFLTISSDPLISSLGIKGKRKSKEVAQDIKNLLPN